MTNEEDCSALALGDVFHLTYRFLLELGIADGEDFVNDEDFGFEEGSYGEAQTDCHTGGITLNRGVDIPFAAAEVNDLVQLGLDLCTAHAQDSSVHEDILPSRHLAMETCADFEEGADTAVGTDGTGGGACDAGEELEEGGFTGTVLADDAYDVALLDLEVDIPQGPYIVALAFGAAVVGLTDGEVGVFFATYVHGPPALEVVRQGAGGDQP